MRACVPVRFMAVVLSLVTLSAPLCAQQPPTPKQQAWDASLGVQIATTGFGVQLGKLLTSHVGARVGVNFMSYNTTQTKTDVTFDASVKLNSVAFLVDLFPAARHSFHFTGGLHTNPLKATGTAVPTAQGTFKINDRQYTASQVGTFIGNVKLPGAAPYAGLGFGTPATSHATVKMRLDLGAILAKPKLVLTATGASGNSQLAADLAAQQVKTQHDLDKVKAYPVIAIGLAYKR